MNQPRQFRKKPVVIEAVQFFEDREPWPDGVRGEPGVTAWISTLEGDMDVSDGDWIVTGIKGEKYPVKPDIFDATYEPVEDDGFTLAHERPLAELREAQA